MRSPLYILLSALTSCLWAALGIYGATTWGRDFHPIVETMAILKSFDRFHPTYVFSGNIISVYLFSILPVSAYTATLLLYATASFLRSLFFLTLLGPILGFFYLFSFMVNHDFNQSRLSIALIFFFLFLVRETRFYGVAAVALHYSLAPLVIVHYIFRHRRVASIFTWRLWLRVALFWALSDFSLRIIKEFLPRYFLHASNPIPLNSILYAALSLLPAAAMTLRARQLFSIVFIIYTIIFAELLRAGLPAIYFGRAMELIYLYSLYLYLAQWVSGEVSRNLYGNGLVNLSMAIVGLYQVSILGGNIWRFL